VLFVVKICIPSYPESGVLNRPVIHFFLPGDGGASAVNPRGQNRPRPDGSRGTGLFARFAVKKCIPRDPESGQKAGRQLFEKSFSPHTPLSKTFGTIF